MTVLAGMNVPYLKDKTSVTGPAVITLLYWKHGTAITVLAYLT